MFSAFDKRCTHHKITRLNLLNLVNSIDGQFFLVRNRAQAPGHREKEKRNEAQT